MFRKMTISKKIGFGFGLILLSLLCLVVLCFTGVGSIVDNAAQVIYGNALDAEMGQREIDHLNWVNQVNRLLTDDQVTTLDAQLDHTKCAFGKWLYGDPRKEAQQHVQGLDVIFREIEEPHQHLHESAAQIKTLFHQADAQLPGLLADRISDHLKWSVVIRDCLLTNCDSIKVEIDSTKCALGKWLATPQAQLTYKNATKEMREAWDQAVSFHQSLHQSAQKINDDYRQVHEGLEGQMLQMLVDHKDWAQQLNTVLLGGDRQIHLEADPHQCRFGKFLESQACKDWMNAFPAFKKAIEQSKEPHKHLHESATTIQALMAQGPEGLAKAVGIYQQITMPALDQIDQCFNSAIEAEGQLVKAQRGCLKQFNEVTLPLLGHTIRQLDRMKSIATSELQGMKQANAIYSSQTLPNLQQVQKLLADARKKVSENIMTEEAMLVAAKNTKKNVGMLGTFGIIAGIVLAIVIAMSIIKPLRRIIDAMESGSAQVTQASEQISSSSQSMADGASEQASSLEQTSASLEQMNATVRQNAENALQANKMAETARQISVKSNEAMKRLTLTIGKIKTSSDQTSGILKTIDEIAFQTNLLALNAAVEAARAGEAGKGFAVVAEEVRSLAQRSAQASKSTAQLIEDACRNADQGVNVAGEAESTLSQIDGAVDHVTQLINLVSAASSEQADGIDQITKAVGQMDQVTQSNAANSEESAAASEELSAQAGELNSMVDELVAMVMGPRKIAQVTARSVVKASAGKPAAHRHMQMVQVTHAGHSRRSGTRTAQHVIALDDDDQISEF